MEYQAGCHPPVLVVLDADGELPLGLHHGVLLPQLVPGHCRDRDSCDLAHQVGGVARVLDNAGLVGGHHGQVLHQQGDVHGPRPPGHRAHIHTRVRPVNTDQRQQLARLHNSGF